MRTLLAHTDGASRGNPGESGIGVIIKDESGLVVYSEATYIGLATNNIAEYKALIRCLEKVSELKCDKLLAYSDSELMVRQVNGLYKVRNPGLRDLYFCVRRLIQKAEYSFSIFHVSREENREADVLANDAIDEREKVKNLRAVQSPRRNVGEESPNSAGQGTS